MSDFLTSSVRLVSGETNEKDIAFSYDSWMSGFKYFKDFAGAEEVVETGSQAAISTYIVSD